MIDWWEVRRRVIEQFALCQVIFELEQLAIWIHTAHHATLPSHRTRRHWYHGCRLVTGTHITPGCIHLHLEGPWHRSVWRYRKEDDDQNYVIEEAIFACRHDKNRCHHNTILKIIHKNYTVLQRFTMNSTMKKYFPVLCERLTPFINWWVFWINNDNTKLVSVLANTWTLFIPRCILMRYELCIIVIIIIIIETWTFTAVSKFFLFHEWSDTCTEQNYTHSGSKLRNEQVKKYSISSTETQDIEKRCQLLSLPHSAAWTDKLHLEHHNKFTGRKTAISSSSRAAGYQWVRLVLHWSIKCVRWRGCPASSYCNTHYLQP